MKQYVYTPLKEFYLTITKPREGWTRAYIYVLLVIYSGYWANTYSSQVLSMASLLY